MTSLDIELDQTIEKKDQIKTVAKIVFCSYLLIQSIILIIVAVFDDTKYESKYFIPFGIAYGVAQIAYVIAQSLHWFNKYLQACVMSLQAIGFAVSFWSILFASSFVFFVLNGFTTAPFYMTYFIILLANGTILIVSAILSVLVIFLLK